MNCAGSYQDSQRTGTSCSPLPRTAPLAAVTMQRPRMPTRTAKVPDMSTSDHFRRPIEASGEPRDPFIGGDKPAGEAEREDLVGHVNHEVKSKEQSGEGERKAERRRKG